MENIKHRKQNGRLSCTQIALILKSVRENELCQEKQVKIYLFIYLFIHGIIKELTLSNTLSKNFPEYFIRTTPPLAFSLHIIKKHLCEFFLYIFNQSLCIVLNSVKN